MEPINVKKIHIGSTRNQSICGPLYIDGWKETDVASVETEITQNKDAYESKTFLNQLSEKYFGDKISHDDDDFP